jgi:hypothetical protein
MEMLHLAITSGLEWLHDAIEARYGRVAAWLVTFSLVIGFASVIIWIMARFVFR